MKIKIAIATALLIAPIHAGFTAPLGEIVEFGYYEVLAEGERFEAPKSTSGTLVAAPTVKLLQQTDTIPIEPGRLFGFRFRLSGFSTHKEVVIREVVVHPPMTKPDKTISTGFETRIGLNVQPGDVTDYAGYRLDHDYEMVEGEWRFEFWHNDKKLLEKNFTTVKQAEIKLPPDQSAAPSQPAIAR